MNTGYAMPFRPPTALLGLLLLSLQGCGGTVNLEGVYFPSWVVCLTLGVIGSLVSLTWLQRSSLREVLPHRGLCFVCITATLSVFFWLLLFRI